MSETLLGGNRISRLLKAWNEGCSEALDDLLPLVYDELHRQAHRLLRRERQNHTLQTTALIHEAYLKLVGQNRVDWQNRDHFFAVSANLMRRILVNHAKARQRKKRGGSAENVDLDESLLVMSKKTEAELLGLDEALTRLGKMDKQQEQIVELRYFSGLTIEETANVLGVSPATIKRDWRMTKAWLYRELCGRDSREELA